MSENDDAVDELAVDGTVQYITEARSETVEVPGQNDNGDQQTTIAGGLLDTDDTVDAGTEKSAVDHADYIRRELVHGRGRSDLAAEFGCSDAHISKVAAGREYIDATVPPVEYDHGQAGYVFAGDDNETNQSIENPDFSGADPRDHADYIRRELLSGRARNDLADEFGAHTHEVSAAATGMYNYFDNADETPVAHDSAADEYRTLDDVSEESRFGGYRTDWSATEVARIREGLSSSVEGVTVAALADEFDCREGMVSRIAQGETWGTDPDVPPVEWDDQLQAWRPVDGSSTETDAETPVVETEATETESEAETETVDTDDPDGGETASPGVPFADFAAEVEAIEDATSGDVTAVFDPDDGEAQVRVSFGGES